MYNTRQKNETLVIFLLIAQGVAERDLGEIFAFACKFVFSRTPCALVSYSSLPSIPFQETGKSCASARKIGSFAFFGLECVHAYKKLICNLYSVLQVQRNMKVKVR